MTQHPPTIQVLYPESVPGLSKLWSYTTGDAMMTSPVVADEVVYIGSEDHHVYALEAKKTFSCSSSYHISQHPGCL